MRMPKPIRTLEIPTIFIVFGATGDLMARKIVPSLYFLYKEKRLPNKFKILGFSKGSFTDTQFQNHVFNILKKKGMVSDKKRCKGFLELFHFQEGSFEKKDTYKNLKKHLVEIEEEWKICPNKMYYFAVPPSLLGPIVKNLKNSKLSDPCGGPQGWARFMIEKPIGTDSKTARELEKLFTSFNQEQLYRIDHYLGKEMVQGIMNFRFSNNLLEHSWNNQSVEKIEFKLFESIGVEDRGSFYDNIGTLRDVGQNHLLEMVALLTMNSPENAAAKEVRREREHLLKALHKPSTQEAANTSFRAQYKGYKKIKGVKRTSTTETYFKFTTHIDNDRWRGVPISIESGKRMGKVNKEIVVHFRHPRPCICPPAKYVHNKVIFSLHPDQAIFIEFWTKKPGFSSQMERRKFEFMLYTKKTKQPYTEEYAKLLFDAIKGDQTWFVSRDEVREMWKAVDPIIKTWEQGNTPLHTYTPDTQNITTIAAAALAQKQHLSKNIGIIGLGKMGGNHARRMLEFDWNVWGYNRSVEETNTLKDEGLHATFSIKELANNLPAPRIIWLMVPAGKPVDEVLFGKKGLTNYLQKGDLIIDGGNSFYKNTLSRAAKLKKKGIHFLDCGVSGGPRGARMGACLMIGGDKKIFKQYEQLFIDLAQPGGYQFFEGTGAGHFVKMVHNGIEYGMMQAIGEGFEIMKKSNFNLDLTRVADVYNNGSVIESRLIQWLKDAFEVYGEDLTKISGKVAHSGEGEWTTNTAHELHVLDKVIHEAFKFRQYSQNHPSYAGKIVSSLRGQFGQHSVEK